MLKNMKDTGLWLIGLLSWIIHTVLSDLDNFVEITKNQQTHVRNLSLLCIYIIYNLFLNSCRKSQFGMHIYIFLIIP